MPFISAGVGDVKLIVLNNQAGAPSQVVDLNLVSKVCPPIPQYPKHIWWSKVVPSETGMPLVCGGYPDTSACYQLTPGGWILHSRMREARFLFSFAKNNFGAELIYAALGSTNQLTGNQIEYFNQTSNTWNLSSVQLPLSISGLAALFINETTLFCTGGQNLQVGFLNTTFFISPIGITQGPLMKVARTTHGFSRVARDKYNKEYVYLVAGGYGIPGLVNSVEVFDAERNEWQDGPPLPFPTADLDMTEDSLGGVLITGGYSPYSQTGSSVILHLPHAGPDATWKILLQKLNGIFFKNVALVIPNHLNIC